MKFDRLIRYYKLRFSRLKGDPRFVAGGIAIGVFVGLTPTVPFNTVLAIGLTLLTRTSLVAAFLASWAVGNPLTLLPIYYISYVLGDVVTPYDLHWADVKHSFHNILHGGDFQQSLADLSAVGWDALIVLQVGGLVFALPFSILAYYLSLKFFIRIRQKRQEKHILR